MTLSKGGIQTGKLRYGCETFSWVMSGEKYVGECPHICEVIRRAGLAGIESNAWLMGRYFDDALLWGRRACGWPHRVSVAGGVAPP